MFSEEENNAFYEGKKNGYEEKEYSNPHQKFIDQLTSKGLAYSVDNPLHTQYKNGYEWGKAQKEEEKHEQK